MTRDGGTVAAPGALGSAVCGVLGWDQVRAWRAAPLETAAQNLRSASNRLLSLADEVDATATPTGWHGDAADVARVARRTLTRELEEFVAGVAAARSALFQAADAVAVIERRVGDVERFAAAKELSIGAGGVVTDARPPAVQLPFPTLDQQAVQQLGIERQRFVDECVTDMEQVLRAAAEIDADLSGSLAAVVAGKVEAPLVGGLAAADAAGDVRSRVESNPPPSGAGTPAGNSVWWKGLSADEKAYVIAEHPEWIGNRDGVDYTSRDKANRALVPKYRADLLDQRARLQAEYDGFGSQPPASSPPHSWLAQRERMTGQIKGVDDKLASLDAVDTILAKGDRQLLALDVTHERAQAAIAVGNVDTAAHVGVFTPGLTSNVQGMDDYDNQMSNLQLHALKFLHKGDRDASVAMVTWLGYQAPQLSADSLLSDNSVTRAGAARDGGQDLSTFYQGINASRDVDPDLTALGHSYGSTTAGFALTGDHTDTGVDRVAFFGSPGVNAFSAGEVHVPRGQVYYAEAALDPVGDFNRFGLDPSNMPGVQHLDTRTSFDAHGNVLTGIGGITSHVHYLDDGTTSQYNLAAVVAGHPEAAINGNNTGTFDGNPLPQVPINPWGPRQP